MLALGCAACSAVGSAPDHEAAGATPAGVLGLGGAPEKTDAHHDGCRQDADLGDDLHVCCSTSAVVFGSWADPTLKSDSLVHKSAVNRWLRNLHCIFLQSKPAQAA